MRKPRAVGYWYSYPSLRLPANSRFPEPQSLVRPGWRAADKHLILAYLRSGWTWAHWRGVSYCRFGAGFAILKWEVAACPTESGSGQKVFRTTSSTMTSTCRGTSSVPCAAAAGISLPKRSRLRADRTASRLTPIGSSGAASTQPKTEPMRSRQVRVPVGYSSSPAL